jgi:hypothetical protein
MTCDQYKEFWKTHHLDRQDSRELDKSNNHQLIKKIPKQKVLK